MIRPRSPLPPRPLLAIAVGLGLGAASCGARTGIDGGDAAPPAPDLDASAGSPDAGGPDARPDHTSLLQCQIESDCEGAADLCHPVSCQNSRCEKGVPVACTTKEPCMKGVCDPATGGCSLAPLTFDNDHDGYKGPAPGHKAGDPGSCGNDCDDTNPSIHPGAKETCNGIDTDCDGIVDSSANFAPYTDAPTLVSSPDLVQGYAGGIAYSQDSTGFQAAFGGQSTDQHTNVYLRALSTMGVATAPGAVVNTTAGDGDGGPVVWTGDRYGLAWQDRRDGNYEIYFNTFSPTGAKLGPDVRVSMTPGFSVNPALGWNGSQFYVLWQDDLDGSQPFHIFAQLLTADGALLGSPQTIVFDPSENEERPSIAAPSQGVGIVYRSSRLMEPKTSQIRFRAFDPQLTPKGPEVVLAQGGDFSEPSLVWNGTDFVTVWVKNEPFHVFGAVTSPASGLKVHATELSPPGGENRAPVVLSLGQHVLLAWSRQTPTGYNVFTRALTAALLPEAAPLQITSGVGNELANSLVLGANGDVGLLYEGKLQADTGGFKTAVYFTRLYCVPTK